MDEKQAIGQLALATKYLIDMRKDEILKQAKGAVQTMELNTKKAVSDEWGISLEVLEKEIRSIPVEELD